MVVLPAAARQQGLRPQALRGFGLANRGWALSSPMTAAGNECFLLSSCRTAWQDRIPLSVMLQWATDTLGAASGCPPAGIPSAPLLKSTSPRPSFPSPFPAGALVAYLLGELDHSGGHRTSCETVSGSHAVLHATQDSDTPSRAFCSDLAVPPVHCCAECAPSGIMAHHLDVG
eukprot:scaffold4990_cov387-Prasinococcus_capsulatus_cf.AAC.19